MIRGAMMALGVVITSLAATGCFPEHASHDARPIDIGEAGSPSMLDGGGGTGGDPAVIPCDPPKAEALPARSEVLSTDATPMARRVFVADLFDSFSHECGACHVDSNQGGFNGVRVNAQNFATLVDQKAVDAILETDPKKIMPPASAPPSTRPATDPDLALAELLKKWIAAGRPSNYFFLEPEAGNGGSLLKLSKDVGQAMSNLGSCVVPLGNRDLIGSETVKTKQLDDFFATAQALPESLADTDLFTFDARELARHRVIAFAPAYPLWADDAKKVRMVRVPMGQSIVFNKDSQTFTIPDGTRFYKTFMKQVKDITGNVTYKKIETRLIVAKQATCDGSGVCTPKELFGTYTWNEEETEAHLLQAHLRDGTPFSDDVLTYTVDEQQASLVDDAEAAGLTRHYAVPGSNRCIQCHMGSVSQSFVLGFTPLQIRRLPKGQQGIIEDTNDDELSQFQRLLDYGVITDANGSSDAVSEQDVTTLDKSEPFAPRNDYELAAQAYMVGNCGHCHNPRGYPSVLHPELIKPDSRGLPTLDFWPDMNGGIFQFPLESVSPRVHRGLNAEFDVPYITPSIQDSNYGNQAPEGQNPVYTDKIIFPLDPDGQRSATGIPIYAPWRSLIYRNVDTPFTYTEANAIFPHMPLNTPGYDCRVAKIMGDWMVSIPVKRVKQGPESPLEIIPYAEIKPGEAFYDQKLQEAAARLAQYHAGPRYDFCPNTATCLGGSDILDPDVRSGKVQVPQDTGFPLPGVTCAQIAVSPIADNLRWKDGVPDRSSWVVTDATEPSGTWRPRRPDYGVVLFGDTPPKGQTPPTLSGEMPTIVKVVGQGDLHLTAAFKQFALLERPMAYWVPKDQCKPLLANEKTSADFSGDDHLPWLDAKRTPSWFTLSTDYPSPWPRPDLTGYKGLPIYSNSFGATLFDQICRNCHGPDANGKSDLAGTILNLTGGQTRVANLRDGLFGPFGDPDHAGDNRTLEFAREANEHELSPDDIASRYLVWMGLGGTEKVIPEAALLAVANAPVFDERRTFPSGNLPPPPTANMLASARIFCGQVHPKTSDFDVLTGWWPERSYADRTALLSSNGDGDMWRLLCYYDNPGPVWGLTGIPEAVNADGTGDVNSKWSGVELYSGSSYGRIRRDRYPAGALVGGSAGVVHPTLTDDNAVPWCFLPADKGRYPTIDPTVYQTRLQEYWTGLGRTDPIPYCPPFVLASDSYPVSDFITPQDIDNGVPGNDREWEIRAAANAGRAVFAYIDSLSRGAPVKPRNSECEKLMPPSSP